MVLTVAQSFIPPRKHYLVRTFSHFGGFLLITFVRIKVACFCSIHTSDITKQFAGSTATTQVVFEPSTALCVTTFVATVVVVLAAHDTNDFTQTFAVVVTIA